MKSSMTTLILAIVIAGAANAQSSPAVDLANKIADKMKDTLGLSQGQRSQIFAVNIHLYDQKKGVLQRFQNRDSISRRLQMIENTRDSLYNEKLTPAQFQVYREKKRHLVNNN